MKIEEFKVGKWYKNLGSKKEWIGKYAKKAGYYETFWGNEWIDLSLDIYDVVPGCMSDYYSAELCSLEEIQKWLPDNHKDKIKVKQYKVKDNLKPLKKLLENIK